MIRAMLTDFHSHILPGLDDGSASLEESLEMLRMEAGQGVDRVVATPHFYARYDKPETFLEKRDRAEKLLRDAIRHHANMPELYVGTEVYYFRGMSESELLPQLTIQGGRGILIEMPHGPWPEEYFRELAAIWDNHGIIPVIAHIDRYIGLFRNHRLPEQLAALPVLVQANAAFFLERSTSAMAMRLLKGDRIQLVGSDCHNTGTRAPNLGQAEAWIRQKLGTEVLERIVSYEKKILYG